MRKIPTLYVRNPDDPRNVTEQVHPGCEWVIAGEGVPTRKFDGTSTMLDDEGNWWGRREVKPGKSAPDGFQPVEHDKNTGKTVGWEPIAQTPFAKFHAEALADPQRLFDTGPGTYELIGPKVNGNPEGQGKHSLVPHGIQDVKPYGTPAELIAQCREKGWEGIVWHHADGRMAKLKVRDYPQATR